MNKITADELPAGFGQSGQFVRPIKGNDGLTALGPFKTERKVKIKPNKPAAASA